MKKELAILMLLASFQVQAESETYIYTGVGTGEIYASQDYRLNNTKTVDTLDFQIYIGHSFSNNLQVEVGHNSRGSVDLFGLSDSYSMSENVIMLGYPVELTPSIKFVPRIGMSFWTFNSSEGWSLNSGPEKEYSEKGNDPTYSLSLTYKKIFVTYQSSDYEFGSMTSFIFGVQFGL